MTLKDQLKLDRATFFNTNEFAQEVKIERLSGRSFSSKAVVRNLDPEIFAEYEGLAAEILIEKIDTEEDLKKYEKIWDENGFCWQIEKPLTKDVIGWKVLATRKLRPSI
jgi:antitoxin component of MazEF toxin-antitoxin module